MLKKLTLILPWLGDFGQGMLAASFVTWLMDEPLTLMVLLVALVFSVIPDLDGIFEFLTFGNIAASKERVTDHREGLHYPLLWLVAGVISIFWLPFWGTLATICVLLHFFNDIWGTGWGVQLWWPFSKRWVKLNAASQAPGIARPGSVSMTPEEKQRAIIEHGSPTWLEDLYLKLSWISAIEYSLFMAGLLAILFTWYTS